MDKHHVDRLYLLIGRIATDFSSIEQLWYLIFTCFMDKTKREITDTIFNQFKSGRQQRQLILEVSEHYFPDKHALKSAVSDLIERTWKAADRRNDAIHSVIQVSNFTVPPRVMAGGISKRSKLADKDIEKEICDLYRTVALLEMDMQDLRLKMIEHINPQDSTLSRDKQQLAAGRLEIAQLLDSDPILRVLEGRS